ncbi:MAG: hemolysin family protein [Bacteroidetes bacterium]|nr:hemolysin family protein [Bacteroidota bacterium]MDA1149115.1 hemolysin family protein [Bacteroidota bacterium]
MNNYLLIIGSALLLSAFFSGMEIAFVSSNRIHIELEKKRKGLLAQLLRRLTSSPAKFIASMLIGNNLALVVYGYYMGKLLIEVLPKLTPESSAISVLVFGEFQLLTHTLISTLVILLTAEFLPKAIFQIYANRLMKALALPAFFFYSLFSGFSWLVIKISDLVLKVIKADAENPQASFTKLEIGDYITQQMESASDSQEIDAEVQIFQNALEFAEVKAREVMIPRTEITAVELRDSIANLSSVFIETGYSKILVYRDSIDNIVGHVHSFDLFKRPRSIRTLLKPVEYVPETMPIHDVLNLLTKKRRSMAVVLDEYGGTSGILTIEDIVEELFGEIEDEHDVSELIEQRIDEHTFLFSGRHEVDYLNQTYKLQLPESEQYETLGGLVVSETEAIPDLGSQIQLGDYRFTIEEVASNRIEQIRLEIKPSE